MLAQIEIDRPSQDLHVEKKIFCKSTSSYLQENEISNKRQNMWTIQKSDNLTY